MNTRLKQMIDICMIVGMFLSMSLQLFGTGTHKFIGLFTFILFLVHNFLNLRWYKSLFRGKYKAIRVAHTITNLVVVIAMFGVMASGVLLSKEMAQGIADGSMTMGRLLHLLFTYIGCVGIAFHIGFHLRRMREND